MAGIIGKGVSLRGLYLESCAFTFNITGTINKSEDIGKAVSLDATAANSAKLAADGAQIIGVLGSYEDRVQEGVKVGTVMMKGGFKVSNAANAVAVGNYVVGAGSGAVKPAAEGVVTKAQVVEIIDSTNCVILVM